MKEGRTKPGFQGLDLMADRPRSYAELGSSVGEAKMTRGSLKGAKGAKGWEGSTHTMN